MYTFQTHLFKVSGSIKQLLAAMLTPCKDVMKICKAKIINKLWQSIILYLGLIILFIALVNALKLRTRHIYFQFSTTKKWQHDISYHPKSLGKYLYA